MASACAGHVDQSCRRKPRRRDPCCLASSSGVAQRSTARVVSSTFSERRRWRPHGHLASRGLERVFAHVLVDALSTGDRLGHRPGCVTVMSSATIPAPCSCGRSSAIPACHIPCRRQKSAGDRPNFSTASLSSPISTLVKCSCRNAAGPHHGRESFLRRDGAVDHLGAVAAEFAMRTAAWFRQNKTQRLRRQRCDSHSDTSALSRCRSTRFCSSVASVSSICMRRKRYRPCHRGEGIGGSRRGRAPISW